MFGDWAKAVTVDDQKTTAAAIEKTLWEDTPVVIPYTINTLGAFSNKFQGIQTTAMAQGALVTAASLQAGGAGARGYGHATVVLRVPQSRFHGLRERLLQRQGRRGEVVDDGAIGAARGGRRVARDVREAAGKRQVGKRDAIAIQVGRLDAVAEDEGCRA